RLVQQRLKAWGYYNGPVTGYYGELTKAAVIKFQKKHGLNAQGYLGPLTLEKIGINVQSSSSGSIGGTDYDSSIITKVQQRLKDWGYYDGPITGYYGELTTAAVIKFQKKHGLNAQGFLGPLTLEKIGISAPGRNPSTNNTDLNLLAKVVYAESRGEPYAGQVAVAAVVLNRVESADFPNTIAGVVYQPWAFSVVNDGQINLTPNQAAYNAARDALNGWDPTYGCTFYYNPATATSQWIFQKPIAVEIGRHVFCY
ncbi:MAG: spore cortex-lytic enzyme, partial [Clostridia bacterium]|nr:spore cortex-lytic enzyme [Clostridia bacterium]